MYALVKLVKYVWMEKKLFFPCQKLPATSISWCGQNKQKDKTQVKLQ